MNVDAIQMICDRLGTTVNQLIPEVIKYTTKINIWSFIFGIIMLAAGVAILVLARKSYVKDEWGICWIALTIVGCAFSLIGFLFTIIYTGELIAMNASPQVYAYKTIFGWIGGN